jgi:hypothetical protein
MTAAQELGWTEIAAVRTALIGVEATAFAIADNRSAELAEWSDDLAGVLKSLADANVDLEELGFAQDDLEKISKDFAVITEDEVPETPVDPITKTGDLWILGEHRVMCGDSTKVDDVARLMNGQDIGAIHADPPYGMNVDTHFDGMFLADPSHRKTGARFNAVIGDESTGVAIAAMQTTPHCESQFWWGADYYRHGLPDGGGWFVWDKRWNDAGMNLDSVAGNCFELCWSKHAHKRRVFRITWSGHHGMQGADTKSRVHPNQKPVQLVVELLSLVGGIVYDPFLGSGTTLIAAEQLGRKCYGMEISPAYCDVIVQRWENLTGKKAVLENRIT